MPDPTAEDLPRWAKDIHAAALAATGRPGGSSGMHQLLTAKLQRLRDTIDRGLAALADKPDPDLTILLEHMAKQLGEAMIVAVELDTLATIERNLPAMVAKETPDA